MAPLSWGFVPSRLRPTNPTAADAILVGDPGRALLLAQHLLVNPLMSNHARGLWGYSAATEAGHPLTVQATGMGGPSAAIVLSDLARLGVQRAVRVGTCEALSTDLVRGDIVLVESAIAEDGTSRALATSEGETRSVLAPRGRIQAELAESGLKRAQVHSGDLGTSVRWAIDSPPPAPPVEATTVFDLQTATLFALAERLGIEIAALLVVEGRAGDGYRSPQDRPGVDGLEQPILTAGQAAADALSKPQA